MTARVRRGTFARMDGGAVDLPSAAQAGEVLLRLVMAVALGGALGFERQLAHKPAGLRTHMLVALGAALFVIAPHVAGASADANTRVVQGIATGIGFVGAGAIMRHREHIEGLTTASGIWLTAAVGVAVAEARLWLSVVAVVMALVILIVVRRFEP
jgi:putative Mg2+ transporter-C (MgtC) family protein